MVTIVAAASLAAALLTASQGAARLAARLTSVVTALSRRAPTAPLSLRDSQFFTGTPAVGVLFLTPGGPGSHFCTASVVSSPAGDLVITAAHCVTGVPPGQLAFAPGYHDGREPYGVWRVTRVFVDQAWAGEQDPDHDVAFLLVHRPGSAVPVQSLTGAERLGSAAGTGQWVRVIGYPQAQQRPLSCQGRTRAVGAHQQEFDCAGYTDGTSGGPFLGGFDPATGQGTVIGVIGGYQQGGDTPAVSYSVRFGPSVQALYETAVAGG